MKDYPDFDKPAFETKHLERSKDHITLRMNETDWDMVEAMKKSFRCDQASTVVKKSFELVHNVVHGKGINALVAWLAEPRRVRPGPKTR